MFRALIRKDLQISRLPLLLASCLLVVSPLAIAILMSIDSVLMKQTMERQLFALLIGSGFAIHVTAQLSLAILSANLIAVERVDRSADFLAYLPPNRDMVLRSKATVLGATALILLLVPLALTGSALCWGERPGPAPSIEMFHILLTISAIGVCAAGIGWWASCTLSSNAVAILLALLAPALPSISVLLICLALGIEDAAHAGALLAAVCLATGTAGFVLGTRHYLRRNEP